MCVRLTNKEHCLTFLSVTGLLQVVIALPIIVVSFIVFAKTDLGGALSPFWAGFVVSSIASPQGIERKCGRENRVQILSIYSVKKNDKLENDK